MYKFNCIVEELKSYSDQILVFCGKIPHPSLALLFINIHCIIVSDKNK